MKKVNCKKKKAGKTSTRTSVANGNHEATYVQQSLSPIFQMNYFNAVWLLFAKNGEVAKDLSFEVYCPGGPGAHFRMKASMPFNIGNQALFNNLLPALKKAMQELKISNSENYVLGFDSKIDKYKDVHLLMLDLDSIDSKAEKELRKIRGILFKSGRGYHFIADKAVLGRKNWENRLTKLLKMPALKKHIDPVHVKISIERGFSTLRISSCAVKPDGTKFLKFLD